MKPTYLYSIGLVFFVPACAGVVASQAVASYRGEDYTLMWLGLGLLLIAQLLRWHRIMKDRAETDSEQFVGTVQAISVDDRSDGRDAFYVKNAKGEVVFTVWAKPGRYAMGERLRMRQWVERA